VVYEVALNPQLGGNVEQAFALEKIPGFLNSDLDAIQATSVKLNL
jgi:hypothetical protein